MQNQDPEPPDVEADVKETSRRSTAPNPLPREVRHDLRSSVGQVIGYVELWLDTLEGEGAVPDVEALKADLGRVEAAGRRILDLINGYIDPIGKRARAESGADAEPEPSENGSPG